MEIEVTQNINGVATRLAFSMSPQALARALPNDLGHAAGHSICSDEFEAIQEALHAEASRLLVEATAQFLTVLVKASADLLEERLGDVRRAAE